MAKALLEVKFLHDEGEAYQKMEKEHLDAIVEHRPIIEIDGKTYRIEAFHYCVEQSLFFIMLSEC